MSPEQAVIEAPAVETTEIVLVDLSSVAYPIYLMSGAEPDPDHASQAIIARVRSLTANHPKAAICCDGGRTFRHELNTEYKANRPERDAPLHHQIALAKEQLAADGYPIWSVKGFEADDVIATATQVAMGLADTTVLIVTSDKDLLQLVNPRVRVMTVTNGSIFDADAVKAKFGVRPEQIRDYLTLVGDASDNVKGARGIGAKTAADLLSRFGTLDNIYAGVNRGDKGLKPSIVNSLTEFAARVDDTQTLITLRTDAAIPFTELDTPRTSSAPMEEEMPSDVAESAEQPTPAPTQPDVPTVQATAVAEPKPQRPTDLAVTNGELSPAPADFERQLDPRSLPQAMSLANHMHAARMFNGYGSPQAVLSTILAGRELGLTAIASLRAFHVIEGKHSLAADAMRALVMRSGQAKYFRCVERSAERATFETLRAGDPEPTRLTYTIEEGRAAFVGDDTKWAKSSWAKHTPDMLAARASSKLARLVYADILFGLYSPEELTA